MSFSFCFFCFVFLCFSLTVDGGTAYSVPVDAFWFLVWLLQYSDDDDVPFHLFFLMISFRLFRLVMMNR